MNDILKKIQNVENQHRIRQRARNTALDNSKAKCLIIDRRMIQNSLSQNRRLSISDRLQMMTIFDKMNKKEGNKVVKAFQTIGDSVGRSIKFLNQKTNKDKPSIIKINTKQKSKPSLHVDTGVSGFDKITVLKPKKSAGLLLPKLQNQRTQEENLCCSSKNSFQIKTNLSRCRSDLEEAKSATLGAGMSYSKPSVFSKYKSNGITTLKSAASATTEVQYPLTATEEVQQALPIRLKKKMVTSKINGFSKKSWLRADSLFQEAIKNKSIKSNLNSKVTRKLKKCLIKRSSNPINDHSKSGKSPKCVSMKKRSRGFLSNIPSLASLDVDPAEPRSPFPISANKF
ncbi:unnamed protein product [Moneuplotes crassus]|uniref:Uncharacterized protein n=1 Tax=Euplotes crassus TaxID=5936 RepID=A0AAD1UQV5_EUPCR|nr:unnamed protein product [Moneuplotes crassus]